MRDNPPGGSRFRAFGRGLVGATLPRGLGLEIADVVWIADVCNLRVGFALSCATGACFRGLLNDG
ncbi:hypothetical protein ROLI_014690 [Roseobacter fucihabitans]|uniref:Uncharacterized protein n=1 Tax=Roseobacter fucihabitans TaxID=1537242 RepID=A0ABZ2BQX1_9RHOB|nr:hypothetical protein [Roseobacter litoralis]